MTSGSVKIRETNMDDENRPRRKYELKQRADEMARTRQRITEAAVHLHGTIGPARTTLSAVAREAGVQRQTVYRHFPTDADLLAACSTHYMRANPLPELDAWRAIDDPRDRLATALDALYAYYERTQPMFSNVMRDVELVDELPATLVPLERYLDEAVEILSPGWGARGQRARVLLAALRHVLDFGVWRSLATDPAITRADAVALMTSLVAAAAAPRSAPA